MRIVIPVAIAFYGFPLGSLALAWYTSTWRMRLGWTYAMAWGGGGAAGAVGWGGTILGSVGDRAGLTRRWNEPGRQPARR